MLYKANSSNTSLAEWALVNGKQKFYQPSTVELPSGITTNAYGWIDCPTSTEIVIPFMEIRPGERRELLWFSEKIVCNSSSPVRMSLEGNVTYDASLGQFDPNGWFTQSGYTVFNTKDHDWQSTNMIRSIAGEAMRLRVFPSTGNNNDFYFKFIAYEINRSDENVQ